MNINGAANAYSNVQKIVGAATSGVASGAAAASGGFGQMVSEAINSGVSTIKNTENVAASSIAGKASITDVVSAVNSADIALKTIVTVRDKVIAAYQDIIKMPI